MKCDECGTAYDGRSSKECPVCFPKLGDQEGAWAGSGALTVDSLALTLNARMDKLEILLPTLKVGGTSGDTSNPAKVSPTGAAVQGDAGNGGAGLSTKRRAAEDSVDAPMCDGGRIPGIAAAMTVRGHTGGNSGPSRVRDGDVGVSDGREDEEWDEECVDRREKRESKFDILRFLSPEDRRKPVPIQTSERLWYTHIYMWIHVDTCGYMGIHVDIWVYICMYIYII